MDDLVTWLRARLDEDERAAIQQRADDEHFDSSRDPWAVDVVYVPPLSQLGYPADPARVLAEVEAKRRILDMHPHQRFIEPPWPGEARPVFGEDPRYVGCSTCDKYTSSFDATHQEVLPGWWCDTVRLLALPYADQPGYREEWRP